MTNPILTDEEIAAICEPLTQGYAQIRFLRNVVKVQVERKPNGRPLVRRCDWERRNGQTPIDHSAAVQPNWGVHNKNNR